MLTLFVEMVVSILLSYSPDPIDTPSPTSLNYPYAQR